MVSGRSPCEEMGGGHCSYVRAHAWAAQEAGYDVHIYCVSNKAVESGREPYGTVHHVSAEGIPPRQRYVKKLARPLATSMVKQRDVWSRAVAVHSFGVWAYAGCLAVEQIQSDKPLRHIMNMYTVYRVEVIAQLMAVNGPNIKKRLRYIYDLVGIAFTTTHCERYAYRHCDTLVVNYQCVKDLVVRHHGRHNDLRIEPYGPESNFVSMPVVSETIPDGSTRKLVVMTIALQRPKKGVRVLLDAFAILKKESIPFVGRIAGAGEMRDDNIRYMNELGLQDDVDFPGFIEQVDPWLHAADIYVQPSLQEESGSLALLEAMRIGLPVLCSGIDGMAEDIRHGIDGITVPPGNAGMLADAIKELILHEDKRSRFAQAAENRFAARHGKAIFIRSMKALYEPDPTTAT